MDRRLRHALLVGILVLLALPGAASAQRTKVLADCQRNDGVVAGQYSVAQLRSAYRAVPTHRRVSNDCGQSIASHLAAKRGLRGGRKAGDVLEDCTRHGGRLTLKFAPHALQRAATRMTTARREQTRCLIGILSQLRARERPIAVNRPKAAAVEGPYDDRSGAELRKSLAEFTAALRRPLRRDDGVPQTVVDELERRNEDGAGFDLDSVRRVGPGGAPIWLITADGKLCGIRTSGADIDADIACVAANRWARGEALLRLEAYPDAHYDVWGVVPDAFTGGTLLFGDATDRPLVTEGNGVLDPLERLPGAVQWQAYGGRQWYDTTRLPCIDNCLDVPPIAGLG